VARVELRPGVRGFGVGLWRQQGSREWAEAQPVLVDVGADQSVLVPARVVVVAAVAVHVGGDSLAGAGAGGGGLGVIGVDQVGG
jgi:hypothetical protein